MELTSVSPDGTVVRSRSFRVRELMSRDLMTLLEDDDLQAVREIMDWRHIRHIPIVSQTGQLVGLVTHRDLLKLSISVLADVSERETTSMYRRIKMREIMGRKIRTIDQDAPIEEAANLLVRHKIGCLPVLDDEQRLVGILTESDFVRLFAAEE